MAKPDGKKGPKKAAPSAVKVIKPAKVPGTKPDFTPRMQKASMVVVSVSDKPENIWHGYIGLVDTRGMRLSVSKQKHPSGHEFRGVHVVSAPSGTELYGLAGSRVYVSVADLHWPNFRSPFKEGSPDYLRQERLWNFLNRLFTEMKLKGSHAVVATVEEAVVPAA